MEKYSCYDFEILLMPEDEQYRKKWYYIIYGEGCPPYDDGRIESDEWFESEQEARYAAVGHIGKLEDGAEPDYDKESASIDWDERRRLGE